jgi:hypothetical protein
LVFPYLAQASAVAALAEKAKSFKDLDPAAKAVVAALRANEEKNPRWMLVINAPVEIDA